MYASSFIARGKAALQGSETEQRIAVLLYDESVQVISTFELNQLASLTYHEGSFLTSSKRDMIDILLEHLEQIMTSPVNYSIVSVQKAVVVTKHLLLHCAEKVVPCIIQQLGRSIDMLRTYNTVLAAQQQSSSTAWLLRLKGGGVDSAGPVRELSEQIFCLISNTQRLQFERCSSADPNSLVPVGDRRQVAFVTDELRLEQLKKRMQEEQAIITRSNLAKASDGFGSGYMSANGKTVVGAAHGIEEMIKQKQKEEQRFSDESSRTGTTSSSLGTTQFSEYLAPDLFSQVVTSQENPVVIEADLLSLNHTGSIAPPLQNVDLLDFEQSAASSFVPQARTTQQHPDLLVEPALCSGTSSAPQLATLTSGNFYHQNCTWHNHSPVPSLPLAPNAMDPCRTSSIADSSGQSVFSSFVANHQTELHPNVDRFAALDALAVGGMSSNGTPTASAKSSVATAFADLNFFATKTNVGSPLHGFAGLNTSTLPESATPTHYAVPNANVAPSTLYSSVTSSIRVGQQFGGDHPENDDHGFVMGGVSGTGLDPIGQAPSSAPPPLPSGMFY
jgi:ENTH domain